MLDRIMRHVLQPLLYYMKRWIYYGELVDPFAELFIKENLFADNSQLWTSKYSLNP